jgi:purine nucleosidase
VSAIPLIIDCDPGVDDAVALLMALASPEFDIRAITTVAGNVGSELTARNACWMAQIGGRADIPVFSGAIRPMQRELVDASYVHGPSGLGDLPVGVPSVRLQDRHATVWIEEALRAAEPGELTFALLGPMTNLAQVLQVHPELAVKIDRIVAMGGAGPGKGNITDNAEYNIWADPHAAHLVLASGAPVLLIGLDATHEVRSTAARTARIAALTGKRAKACTTLLGFANRLDADRHGRDGAPLHDPCVIAALLAPDLVTAVPAAISVSTIEGPDLGVTHLDLTVSNSLTGWVTALDADGLFDLLVERLTP